MTANLETQAIASMKAAIEAEKALRSHRTGYERHRKLEAEATSSVSRMKAAFAAAGVDVDMAWRIWL